MAIHSGLRRKTSHHLSLLNLSGLGWQYEQRWPTNHSSSFMEGGPIYVCSLLRANATDLRLLIFLRAWPAPELWTVKMFEIVQQTHHKNKPWTFLLCPNNHLFKTRRDWDEMIGASCKKNCPSMRLRVINARGGAVSWNPFLTVLRHRHNWTSLFSDLAWAKIPSRW